MTEQGKYNYGRFVWHELYTKDVEKTKAFYGELMNWTYETMPMEGMQGGYTMAKVGDKTIAGIVSLDMIPNAAEMKIPPYWTGYVSVADVDAACATAKGIGGNVVAGPMDIPNVGRFATLFDPHGAVINAFRANTGDGDEPTMPTLGTFCWDSLNAGDVEVAKRFYTEVFGWTPTAMPGMDATTIFTNGERQRASMQKAPDGVPPSWLTYLFVENLERATEKATKLGATMIMSNIPVPQFGTFSVIQDNVGAYVALFAGHNP
ncbi:MAG: VOC family protein [Deltaproteobacteria bacterium]|nr:VOC family protein [Deltaproteobacteria bacterium]